MMQERNAAGARKIYEDLLAKYPQAQAPFRAQVHGAIAQTYIADNQAAPALEQLKKALELDPGNTDMQMIYAEMLMQAGDPAQKAEGEKILLGLDITKVKDPFPYMNVVIGQINAKKPDEALALLDKLMNQFPTDMSLYYYRGRANLAAKQAARGQGRPREVRRRVAVGARDAGCEEDSRADEGRQVRAALCALLLAFTMACGGDDGGSTSPPPPGGGGSNQDVCAAVRSEAIEPERTAALAPPSSKRGRLDPSPRWRVLDSLWIHQQAADRRAAISSLGPREASTSDIGDIAVIRDEGDVIVPANAFDLKGVGLRFTRNPSGGYDVRVSDSAFRTAIGNRITLSDDDTARADVAFSFPFFSGSERTAFVNSDGNITFREGDNASTDRSVGRLLTGPPRVAAFLADLDPSAGGTVFVNAASDQYTVTWCAVRGFDSAQTTTDADDAAAGRDDRDAIRRRHHAAGCRHRPLAWPDPRFPRPSI